MGYYKKLTEYYVFTIICIIPLFFLPFIETDAFRFPKFILWTISFFITIAVLLINSFKSRSRIFSTGFNSKIYLVLGVYAFIWIISTIFSVDRIVSLTGILLQNGLGQLFMCIITFLLISHHFEFKLRYIKYIAIVYCIISIITILQFYKADPFVSYYGTNLQNYIGQTFSTIGNQNQVSTCLSVAFIVIAFFFIIGDNNIKTKLLYFISALIIFAGGIATQTRGGWIAISCTLLISLPYIIKNKVYLKRYILIGFACLVVLLFIDITSGNTIFNRILSVFFEAGQVAEGEINGNFGSQRVDIWINSIELVKNYWLIGSGPDTFTIVYDDFGFNIKDSLGEKIMILSPHNESLKLLITTGIFSLITYWVIVVSIMTKGIKKIKDNKYVIPFILGLVCYLVKTMFNCSAITDILIFWVLLALIFSFEKEDILINRN